ncbi:hypothetical protein COL922a_010977 [Colletotrichum nupharicola]|nr:hypothetical protein COL922a_010977 [Colletotrichum nupharicola]
MDANRRAAARTVASDYVVTESPLGTARKLRVLMVGAGASGLNLARHMDLHMESFELTIYEKNSDVGGTCYSEWDEILEYFRGIAKKYELYKYIKLSQKLTSASWDEASGVWNVECLDLSTGNTVHNWGHVLINGTGVLNNWKWPNVAGLHSFKGDLFHSATWDPEYQVAEKTVAVLGTGSSGIQIVATLQPLTEEQKTNFKKNPDAYMKYRKEIEGELNSRFRFVIADSADQKEAREYSSNEMRVKLKDEDILNYLMPKNFAVGCRRPTPGNGYLEALTKDNVHVVTNVIEEIVPDGIRLTNGEIIPVDVFVCATGFDLSFCPRFKLIGRDGESIDEKWKDVPEAYLSVAVSGFPNYFSEPFVSIGGLVRCDRALTIVVFLGPNAPVGHGSVLPIIEHATKYIINMMKKIQSQNIKAVSPSAKAVDDFNQHITEFMKRTA